MAASSCSGALRRAGLPLAFLPPATESLMRRFVEVVVVADFAVTR
jgi:hypothetical protein